MTSLESALLVNVLCPEFPMQENLFLEFPVLENLSQVTCPYWAFG